MNEKDKAKEAKRKLRVIEAAAFALILRRFARFRKALMPHVDALLDELKQREDGTAFIFEK